MKKIIISVLLICVGLLQTKAQTTTINGVVYTTIDGGGKNINTAVTPKGNTIFTNWVCSEGFSYHTNGAAINNIIFIGNTIAGVSGENIFFGSYDSGYLCKNIEVALNTMSNSKDSSQYRWEFKNCVGVNVHNNYIHDMPGKGDGGIIYMDYSQGVIRNNFLDRIHGKGFRCWWAKNSMDTVMNNIVMNTDMYSGMEEQEVAGYWGLNTGWKSYIFNNTWGNYPIKNGTATAAVTTYFPGDLTIGYQFIQNIVFNTSTGTFIDNSGTSLLPWAPTNTNYKTTNFYYATQSLAAAKYGWVGDSVKLPDGTSWNGSAIVPPVQPLPVANAGTAQVIVVGNAVTLNGSASTGTGLTYLWKEMSGPSTVPITNPIAVTAPVTGVGIGVYVFQLTVTDSQGMTSTATVQITITLPAACPPPPVVPVTIKSVQAIRTDGSTQTIQ